MTRYRYVDLKGESQTVESPHTTEYLYVVLARADSSVVRTTPLLTTCFLSNEVVVMARQDRSTELVTRLTFEVRYSADPELYGSKTVKDMKDQDLVAFENLPDDLAVSVLSDIAKAHNTTIRRDTEVLTAQEVDDTPRRIVELIREVDDAGHQWSAEAWRTRTELLTALEHG